MCPHGQTCQGFLFVNLAGSGETVDGLSYSNYCTFYLYFWVQISRHSQRLQTPKLGHRASDTFTAFPLTCHQPQRSVRLLMTCVIQARPLGVLIFHASTAVQFVGAAFPRSPSGCDHALPPTNDIDSVSVMMVMTWRMSAAATCGERTSSARACIAFTEHAAS